jgi:predicted phage terminase large subunit-like protein
MNADENGYEEREREFYAFLKNDFVSFVEKVFFEVSPCEDQSSGYKPNWHIEYICGELTKMVEFNRNRLIINIPPRHMKSIICSIALPAWILGHNPTATIITVSYADDLSEKFASDCRRVMESVWYKKIFPLTRISPKRNRATEFETTRGGGRFASSVNGVLTGRGADYIIIDDPIKPQDANSEAIREKVNEWFSSTLYSRLNDKAKGRIILIMQRLHENDLTGYLLNKELGFRLIKLPSIAEKDELWYIWDHLVQRDWKKFRKKGEALHPERENIELLSKIRANLGEFTFAGQYQQSPVPREGGIIKKEWFQFYNKERFYKDLAMGNIKIKAVFQSWDTANKTSENNDYSCCATFAKDKNETIYLLNVARYRLDFPDLVKQVVASYNNLKNEFAKYAISSKLVVEDKASGTQLIQILKSEQSISCESIKPELDKQSRMLNIAHMLETAKCLFPSDNPHWWADFEKELLTFPKGRHDDQCDAFSQGLAFGKDYYSGEASVSCVGYDIREEARNKSW